MLDDPFTEMDPTTRGAAVKVIGEFAQKCQVLLFTCHPLQRDELVEMGGAKAVPHELQR